MFQQRQYNYGISAQLAGAVEYTSCISVDGVRPPPKKKQCV